MKEEKRTLIETFLPIDEISEEAKKEKLGTAKPRTFEMHYWWTRKPLITARAAVLGALLPEDFDQKEFRKILGLEYVKSTGKRAHNYDIPHERIETLKKEYYKVWGDNPIILDPFAGGGSIPFEAMRAGVNTIANDYNPVANLIEKVTLEYPRNYGVQLYQDVEEGLNWVFEETKNELQKYYPPYNGQDVIAYLWAWTVLCPKCGFDTPLVGQWWLANNDKQKIVLHPNIEGEKLTLEIEFNNQPMEKTCSNGKGVCINPKCGAVISEKELQKDIFTREKEILLSIIIANKGKKDYCIPNINNYQAIEQAHEFLSECWNELINKNLVPLSEIPMDTRGSLSVNNYLKYWHQLLNPRQKLLFITLIQKIHEYSLKTQSDPIYSEVIKAYLSLILGKHIDRNCRSATWDRSYEVVSHALAMRGIAMMWDHIEVNPFIKGSGSLIGIKKSILDGIKYSQKAIHDRGNIKISLSSITSINEKVQLIITDPPYFDDVRYAEFSEYFYSWEQIAINIKEIANQIPNTEEMSVGGWGRTSDFFKRMFYLSCKKMNEILVDNGILVMFFAHSSIDAWDFVINALQKNNFRITATWPVHTESPTNILARGNASIMSSIIIVARKRKYEKKGYIEEIQEDVRNHLNKRLDEFWGYGLRGADLTVSAMGATLDVITQFSDIKSYTGEMQIKDVLELVQKYVAQFVLDRYMKNSSGLDSATSFYLYSRLSLLDGMPFDTANLIAKSMNVDLKSFEKLGLIKASKQGKAQGIKIVNYTSREINPKQSLIDCVQFLMTTYAKSGFSEVERELATIPYSRNEIKDVLEALLSLPAEDPERQVSQKILERMGGSFPQRGQTGLDNF